MGEQVRVLYGGSVDKINASMLVKEGNVSGLLIGRQSLEPKDFVEIIKLVDGYLVRYEDHTTVIDESLPEALALLLLKLDEEKLI